MLGLWQQRFCVHRLYIHGTFSGCCRSYVRSRRCRSSSGQLASSPRTTFGICAHLVVRGWFLAGLCCWNTEPWQRRVQLSDFDSSHGRQYPNAQRTRRPLRMLIGRGTPKASVLSFKFSPVEPPSRMFVSLYHDMSIALNFGNHVLFDSLPGISFPSGEAITSNAQPLSLGRYPTMFPTLNRHFFNLPVMALIT